MKREERKLEQCGPVGKYRLKGSVAPSPHPGHCRSFKQRGRGHGLCINEQPLALFYGASDSQGGWRGPSLPEGGSVVPTRDTTTPGCRHCTGFIDNGSPLFGAPYPVLGLCGAISVSCGKDFYSSDLVSMVFKEAVSLDAIGDPKQKQKPKTRLCKWCI